MRPERAVARLTTRELRRGGLTLAAATALYMGMEVVSYDMAYPNGVSADQFEMFLDNPAARVLQGVPQALDTAAGFAVWDGG